MGDSVSSATNPGTDIWCRYYDASLNALSGEILVTRYFPGDDC